MRRAGGRRRHGSHQSHRHRTKDPQPSRPNEPQWDSTSLSNAPPSHRIHTATTSPGHRAAPGLPALPAARFALVAAVRGITSTNSTALGALHGAIRFLAYSTPAVCYVERRRRVASPSTRRPHCSSEIPITTTSAMPGCLTRADSTSAGTTLVPPVARSCGSSVQAPRKPAGM